MRWTGRLPIAVILLLAGLSCGGGEEGDGLREISRTRACRANMNTLCTEMAASCEETGVWASSPDELDSLSGRMGSLRCPESGLDYVIRPDGDGYVIECPSGHGSITTGRRSWCEGSDP